MPILHTLCQQLLMLKIPLQHQTTSHYREEETINYRAGLDCLHETLEWNGMEWNGIYKLNISEAIFLSSPRFPLAVLKMV